jgi:methylglutaconyl-CoA hydratase
MPKTITINRKGEVLEIALARPESKNAFTPEMIAELDAAFKAAEMQGDLRAIALSGQGEVFCSGGDLNWMKETISYTPEQNLQDAQSVYRLFETIDSCKLPVVAAVAGFALGGGVGLVSVCDYVVAERQTLFSLSEVKVGLIPACIGPFVLRKIGLSHARALFLSSERFDAPQAQQIGLIHEVAPDAKSLKDSAERVLHSICSASPQAVKTAKQFLRTLGSLPFEAQGPVAVKTLADIRVTGEAQEGLRAFLEKRPPSWAKP